MHTGIQLGIIFIYTIQSCNAVRSYQVKNNDRSGNWQFLDRKTELHKFRL